MRGATLSPPGQRRPGVGVVIAVGLVVLSAVALAILVQRAPRRSGTDLTADVGYLVPLAPAEDLCQSDELLPADTGALRLAVTGSTPGPLPPLSISIQGASGALTSGRLPPGAATGSIVVPLARVVHRTQAATVCVHNAGSTPLAFGGSVPAQGPTIQDAGRPLNGRLRIEYMRPGKESWLQLLPVLARRTSLAKSDLFRRWEMGAALVFMLTVIALSARILIADDRRAR